MRALALLALAAGATGCASADLQQARQDALAAPGQMYNAAHRALAGPQLQPISNPAPLTGGQVVMPQPLPNADQPPPRPNSLWRAGSRSFFNDQRASRMGDILTVNIEIRDKAEVTNSSDRSRQSSTDVGVSHFFGLEHAASEIAPGAFDPSNLVGAQGQSDSTNSGAINREEKIQLTVAAVIVDQLPNGNLVIAGRQEVRVNGEVRELTVSGVIRPEDISPENTINHTQIAEARISYGGQGTVSDMQQPRYGSQLFDIIMPW